MTTCTTLTRFIHRHPSAAVIAPEEGVVRVLFPLLVVEGFRGAAATGAERAAFPERPVEPVELLEAPRHFDAAARLGVIRRAAAAGDEAVRGVDEDGPHDAVHGAGALPNAEEPWDGEVVILLHNPRRVRESSIKRSIITPIVATHPCSKICPGIPTEQPHHAAVRHPAPP